jgi:copper chaperone CopZ
MKKVYKLQDLDCANCANKMEVAISKIKGVDDVKVNFMMQKLTLSADDAIFEEVLKDAQKAIKKIEPDCKIILR